VRKDIQKEVNADQGAGGGSLAGYEYQIDVSVWLALDLLLGSKQARQLILEPATQEDLETELEEFEPGVATGSAPVASYKLVVQAKLRAGDAWTVANINALLRHGKRRTSVRERLKDPSVHYLLVTSAALNGGTKNLQVAQAGVWPKASKMPAAIKNALLPGSSGRIAIIGSKDEERLKTDIRDLLRDSFRVPNARWESCWKRLREDARARISGAGSGLWKREDLEEVIKKHEGYIASSPELGLYVYPNNWDELRQAIRERHAALIIGQSGTGKTLAAQKLYEELRVEIPGLARVPITRGPAELSEDMTAPPVLYDIEDPWGRFDFDPRSRPWNDQLSQSLSKATHDRIIVATTRLDVGQRSGALDTVEQWMVSLESENYGDSERAELYRSRIDALPRDLQVTASKAQATVLKELSTPLEIQKFFDALPALDREGLRNPEHFVSEAIGRAHQNSIEQTVVNQIEERNGGVRAAAVIWGLLKATNRLSLPVLRTIEEVLSDHEPQMIAEASSLVAFFVAARNLRQSEDLITYYHPRVESGIERALVRSKLEAKRMFRLLVDVLTSSDGPGEEWGAGAAARLIAAIKDSDKFDVSPKPVAAAKVDSWLATRLTEMGAGFDANLKLAAAAGSSSSCEAEVARYLFHDSQSDFGFNHWDRPEKDDAWYFTMRDSPTVRPLLDRFVREILPFSHMHYGTEFSLDLKRLAPDLSDAFLEAADRTVGWGCFSSDDAIAEGALEDIAGFEKIVDGAFEALTPSEVDLRKQEEQRLALTNGEYSEHYAEHISDNDDGFTARQYLQAYVERVRVTVGWRHIKNHRHLERLRGYWLRSIQKGAECASLTAEELAGAFASAFGTVDEDELWYVILRYWDEQYLPSLEMRLLEGCASQETTIAAVACLVTHAPHHLEAIVSQLTSLGSQGQLLEIVASMAHLRDRRAPSGDKLQEATAANMSRLPGPWPEISDAYLDLYNHRPPVLGEAARTILRETTYHSEDVRRLRLAAEVDSSERTLVDIRCLMDSEDSDIAAEGMKAAAREHIESIVESGLSHKFADVRAVALETLGKESPTPLPQSLLSIAGDKGFRVKKILTELLSEKVHPSHEPVLLKLAHDQISNLSHYVGGPDSYPIARAAVEGLSKYESLSTQTIDELYTLGVGTDDPELRSSIFEILASRGGTASQEKLVRLAITPGKTSARRSAAWALLMSRMHLAPEVIEQITTDMLETRIESIAVLLTLIFAATASLEKVRVAAERLAASSKRRVLLLLMIRELTERDVELAKQVALMLPANHPALLWAFGEELAEAHDRLVSDLGNPGICSEVLFFMKPPEK
jgi:hypothetical protein